MQEVENNSHPNHGGAVYIINSARNCISSKRYALYIIKPQENARLRVMRYKGGKPPLMIYTARCAVMICQACGLDKKIPKADAFGIFWRRHPDLNRGIKVLQTSALPLGYVAIQGSNPFGFDVY